MTSTAKNYAGQNLRGRSFKGQDLSGADFSGADLRGTNFTDAILIEANFSNAKTGVKKRWLAFQLIVAITINAVSGYISALGGIWLSYFFSPLYVKSYTIAPGLLAVVVLLIIFLAITFQGFTEASFLKVFFAVTLVFAIAGSVSGVAAAFTGSVVVAFAVAIAVTAAVLGTVIGNIVITVVVAFAVAITVAVCFPNESAFTGSVLLTVCVAAITLLLGTYVAWITLKGDPKFAMFFKIGVIVKSLFGTSFRGANLTESDFTKALLKSSDFRNSRKKITNLTRTLWKQARNLVECQELITG